jgi:hypothetical protein
MFSRIFWEIKVFALFFEKPIYLTNKFYSLYLRSRWWTTSDVVIDVDCNRANCCCCCCSGCRNSRSKRSISSSAELLQLLLLLAATATVGSVEARCNNRRGPVAAASTNAAFLLLPLAVRLLMCLLLCAVPGLLVFTATVAAVGGAAGAFLTLGSVSPPLTTGTVVSRLVGVQRAIGDDAPTPAAAVEGWKERE